MPDRDLESGDTWPTLDRYPAPAIWTGEIVSAALRDASPRIDRHRAAGGAPSMVAHASGSSPLPVAAPLLIAGATGPLPIIDDRYSTAGMRSDDITTARMRAAPARRARRASARTARSSAPSVILDGDVTPVPSPEASGPARAIAAESPDAKADAMPGPMPGPMIEAQIKDLFDLARINDRGARRDSLDHWALKVPAIAGAVAASACEVAGYNSLVVILAMLAAICAAVDGLRPGGLLHKIYRKAANEARRAATTLQAGWQLVQLACEGQLDQTRSRAADLLRAAHAERQRITDYVTAAEASLGSSRRSP